MVDVPGLMAQNLSYSFSSYLSSVDDILRDGALPSPAESFLCQTERFRRSRKAFSAQRNASVARGKLSLLNGSLPSLAESFLCSTERFRRSWKAFSVQRNAFVARGKLSPLDGTLPSPVESLLCATERFTCSQKCFSAEPASIARRKHWRACKQFCVNGGGE